MSLRNTSYSEILHLAIPSIISNITVPLLSLVDIAIVGHIGDAVYLAAISVGAMIFNVMYWILGFLRMGTSGLTAQAFGRNDTNTVRWLFRHGLLLALFLGCVFIALFVPLRSLTMFLMQVGEESRPLVSTYFNICIFGAPAVLGSFALNGFLIGMQNTRIPMGVAIIQNIINIVLSLVFVFCLKMDIAGVALGTMLSQWLAFLVLLYFATRLYKCFISKSVGKDEVGNIKDDKHASSVSWADFFSVNIDIFFRTLCLVAVNLYFTSAGSAQGPVILAVNTLLMTFFTLFSYVMDGFAFAAEALGGKYYGLGDMKNISILHRRLMIIGAGCTLFFTLLYILLTYGDAFLSLLTNDSDVINAAQDYIVYALLIPFCGVLAFIYDGLFIGMTRTKDMLLSCFASACVFFTLYFLLRGRLGNDALWIALLSYLFLRGVILSVRFHLWKK